MNIVYIHQYFRTPEEAGGTRSYFIARALVEAGHHVTMIGSKPEGQAESVKYYTTDGFRVISIRNYYANRLGVFERLKSFFRFMWKATRVLFTQKEVDLVIATSTPLTVGIPALLFKKIRKTPYLFEVRDLWPEAPIQLGALKNPLLRKLALVLEKMICRNASHIVALSPGMKEGVAKVLGSAENISMIPNMAKIDRFWQRERDAILMEELGLNNSTFKIIHFGAMGISNGLDYILDAAAILKSRGWNKIQFIFLGDGGVAPRLIERKSAEALDNVLFFPKEPMARTSEIVNLCDASIVPFLNLPILYTNSPNKLFDSLSAGLPVIVNSAGWTKQMVEENKCGAYVDPDNPNELANLAMDWESNADLVKTMGANARRLAETTYDKSILCNEFVEVVNDLEPKRKK